MTTTSAHLPVWLTFCALVAPFTFSAAELPAASPNVVVVLADDQGWGDLSLHGNPNLSTPSIDSLARDGAHVQNFYVCAVCSPTRAEFLTGRYHNRMGVYSTSTGGERFSADEQTIADLFRAAGYATAAYGKWHSGMQFPYHPNSRGFDDFYGFCSGHWGNYFDPMLEHNGKIVRGKGFIIDDLTDHAIQFISDQREKPFFVYLALNTPHSPMQVPQPYWDRFADKSLTPDPVPENAAKQDTPHTRAALAMCENIDDNVGRLLEHLKQTGHDRDTVVVYFSDNGPNGHRFNGGLRGRKGSTYEGGLRSPCLIRYPDKIPAGTTVEQFGAAIDLMPTLADLAGIDWQAAASPDRPVDGISLAAALCGQETDNAADRILFSEWRNRLTARNGQYRIHSNGQLFDLLKDPREQHDLADQKPEVVERMMTQLTAWQDSWKSDYPPGKRPFTIGHPDAQWTQLPARDATFTGTLQRSNRFPNCTYLLDWTDTESEITWDVEVLDHCRCEVQMYYACPAEDVGASIELSLGSESLTARIDRAAESPLIGAEHDRVPRQEGDVRRWEPLSLGTIELRPGQRTLRLKATKIPGSQVAEMRLLMLRRLPANPVQPKS
ncbi:arylsulfatase [Roseiconus nitratireducens]|uniref:Arylsulfatase n=1 Tax=Roseiconus nitratireducens TaxID=2605748 RepID=A0A5M6DKV9_9BACT|nr:arylsulfatase [Roseiconus nitratireducens]KAA5546869.1 arylsulfatase [Roseiconus nitratireducens]